MKKLIATMLVAFAITASGCGATSGLSDITSGANQVAEGAYKSAGCEVHKDADGNIDHTKTQQEGCAAKTEDE
jgi:predicted small secreted protein